MNDNRTDLGDMTLAQIKGLKKEIRDKIKDAVEGIIESYEKSYGVGCIEIRFERSVEQWKIEGLTNNDIIANENVDYDINIQFSKELEQ